MKLSCEQAAITAAIQQLVNKNASIAMSQEEYERRYDALFILRDGSEVPWAIE